MKNILNGKVQQKFFNFLAENNDCRINVHMLEHRLIKCYVRKIEGHDNNDDDKHKDPQR